MKSIWAPPQPHRFKSKVKSSCTNSKFRIWQWECIPLDVKVTPWFALPFLSISNCEQSTAEHAGCATGGVGQLR